MVNNRDYKNFAEGEIFHVYNRGVGKMDIFLDNQDYQIFIDRLKENLYPELVDYSQLPKYLTRRKLLPSNSYDLISFCLMPNHFHLLIKQNTKLPITQIISKACTGYSKYFNKKYSRVGSVFQGNFKAVRMDKNEQLLWTSFYIHKNPVEAGIVSDLLKYKWSSFPEYFNSQNNNFCKKELILKQFKEVGGYIKWFKSVDSDLKTKEFTSLNQYLFIDYNT